MIHPQFVYKDVYDFKDMRDGMRQHYQMATPQFLAAIQSIKDETMMALSQGKEVNTNGGLKQPPGELCAVDYQRQSPVFHFFLHGITPPFHEFCRDGSKTKAGPPAAAEDNASYRPP